MRALLTLLIALASLSAAAQSFNPSVVLNRMGTPWAEAKVAIPPADSGRVVGKSGDLVWIAPDPEVTRLVVSVRDGRVAGFEASATPGVGVELSEMRASLIQQVGDPGPDGYFSAEQVRQLGVPIETPLVMRIDVERGVMSVWVSELRSD